MAEESSGREKLQAAFDRIMEKGVRDPHAALARILDEMRTGRGAFELNLQGKMAGRWCLTQLIGLGGMGVTYEALSDAGERAAVKVVGQVKAGALARFENECRAIEHLDHPHVVRYLGKGRLSCGRAYMVMEFVEGCDLEHILEDVAQQRSNPVADVVRRRLQEDDVPFGVFVHIMRDLAQTLHAVHAEGLVHRDIKPGNIMLNDELFLTLIDFGLSRDAFRTVSLTQSGAIVGTFCYMAPEQARSGATVDRRVDIYSMGLVLAQCMGGDTLRELCQEPGRPWSVPPFLSHAETLGIPRPLQSILYKAVQPRASGRYREAGQMAEDLTRYLKGEPPLARIPGLRRRLVSHPGIRAAAAAFAISVLVFAMWLMARPEPFYLTVDTINDSGDLVINGRSYIAPVRRLVVEPGWYDIEYAPHFVRPVHRRIHIGERHHNRVNFRTIDWRIVPEGVFKSENVYGTLILESGSSDDVFRIDGKPLEREGRMQFLSPGWHEVECVGEAKGRGGKPIRVREVLKVKVENGELSSAFLLPRVFRDMPGDYRLTLGDISQECRGGLELDLEDGLTFFMNEFSDKMPDSFGRAYVRTCIVPEMPGRSLTVTAGHKFSEPLLRCTVAWQANALPRGRQLTDQIITYYRWNKGTWERYDGELHPENRMCVIHGQGSAERPLLSLEMRVTLKARQKLSSFSTVELFFGYFDQNTEDRRFPAFALVGETVGSSLSGTAGHALEKRNDEER